MVIFIFLLLLSAAVAPEVPDTKNVTPLDTIMAVFNGIYESDKKDECVKTVVKVLKNGCDTKLVDEKLARLGLHIYNCHNQEDEHYEFVKLCDDEAVECDYSGMGHAQLQRINRKARDMCTEITAEIVKNSGGVSAYGMTKFAHSVVNNAYNKMVLPLDATVMKGVEKAATIIGIDTPDVRTLAGMLSEGFATYRTASYFVVLLLDCAAIYKKWFGGLKQLLVIWGISFLMQLFRIEELSNIPVLSFFLGTDAPKLLLKYQHIVYFISNICIGLMYKTQKQRGRPRKEELEKTIKEVAERAVEKSKRRNKK